MTLPFGRPEGDLSPTEQRAAIAALAGPLRTPFGNSRPIVFLQGATASILAVSNAGSPRPLYVEIRQVLGGAAVLLVGGSPNLQFGQQPSFPTVINVAVPFLVLPAEELWLFEVAQLGTTFLVTEVSV